MGGALLDARMRATLGEPVAMGVRHGRSRRAPSRPLSAHRYVGIKVRDTMAAVETQAAVAEAGHPQ